MKKLLMTVIISCLTTAVSEAATYYVAKTGNNSNSCATAQTHTTGKLTLAAGAACLVAGDTLYIKAGTYSEPSGSITLPSATSWAGATTISKYGSDVVTFQSTGSPFDTHGYTLSYVIFNGFVYDGINDGHATGIVVGQGPHHIRFTNFEAKNWGAFGISSGGTSNSNEFINCSVHDNGLRSSGTLGHGGHGIYFSGPTSLLDHCTVYNNGYYGVHVFSYGYSNNNIIRNNVVYNNGINNGIDNTGVPRGTSAGIIISGGADNAAYNNVVYGNWGGIQVATSGTAITGNKVYNNTIYGNVAWGIEVEAGCTSCILKNNIVYLNGSGITNNGTSTVQSNNLTTDPKFVNPSAKNFRLQAGSPAIDAGANLLSDLSGLSVDFAGEARPQGCCIDIGAYEYGSQAPGPGPTAPSNLIASPLTSP